MSNILFCDASNNNLLAQALGVSKKGRCWAVETPKDTSGTLEFGGKYYKRLDSFKEAEAYAQAQKQEEN